MQEVKTKEFRGLSKYNKNKCVLGSFDGLALIVFIASILRYILYIYAKYVAFWYIVFILLRHEPNGICTGLLPVLKPLPFSPLVSLSLQD